MKLLAYRERERERETLEKKTKLLIQYHKLLLMENIYLCNYLSR